MVMLCCAVLCCAVLVGGFDDRGRFLEGRGGLVVGRLCGLVRCVLTCLVLSA